MIWRKLAFCVVELLGRDEAAQASEAQQALLRLLTPGAKLTTARQSVEDTGLPVLLRDAQVFSIWEGTTNVLALDALRAIGPRGLAPLAREVGFILGAVRETPLLALSARIQGALETAQTWWQKNASRDQSLLAALRFAAAGINLLADADPSLSRLLADDS